MVQTRPACRKLSDTARKGGVGGHAAGYHFQELNLRFQQLIGHPVPVAGSSEGCGRSLGHGGRIVSNPASVRP